MESGLMGLAPHSWIALLFLLITIGFKDSKYAALQLESNAV
jgi:hypothetical protein